jgi:beta-lactamase superfamily II metal-dependent hydrolase
MEKLRVRIYNVRFGDAILISVPDRNKKGEQKKRNILVDVGNFLSGEGGKDSVFRPIFDDVLKELGGERLDLYVMTHEHMDHVQGPLYINQKVLSDHNIKEKLRIQHAWLTASSEPSYYISHPEARRKLDETRAVYKKTEKFFGSYPEGPVAVQALMANNNPRATEECVNFIRTLAEKTWYIHRQSTLEDKHPFQEARFEIWAPEEDTSIYYGKFQPVQFGVVQRPSQSEKPTLTTPIPPSGVDAGAFYNLVSMRRAGFMDNLLMIDKAANNTSIVFSLEWRGWRLLFPGDAEYRSWQLMENKNLLKQVQFLKVSHHGSHTGTPPPEILKKFLAQVSPNDRPRFAAVSTFPNTYHGVPDPETLNEIEQRCELRDVQNVPDGNFIDFNFPECDI